MKHRLKAIYQFISRHQNLTVATLITIASICYFWPVLFGGHVVLGHDLALYFHPGRNFFRQSILSGEFPLWCPYPAGGTFFSANSGQSCYYPFTYLNVIFSPSYTLGLFTVIHIIIFTFFFYWLARECNASFLGGFITALAAFLCGTALALLEFSEVWSGLAWYPAVLACFIRLLKNTNRMNTLLLALACAMQVLAGAPYPPFYSLVSIVIISIGYVLVSRPSARALASTMMHTVLAGVIAFFLTAPMLIPMLDFLKGAREFGTDSLFPKQFSMRLADWVPVLIKNALGHDDTFKCYYFGLLPLLMALLGVCVLIFQKLKKSATSVTRMAGDGRAKIIIILLLLAVVSFIFSFGGYIGVDRVFYSIPVLGRCAAHWFSLIGIPFVASMFVLAGLSFDMLIEARHDARFRRIARVPLLLGVISGFALLLFRGNAASALDSFRATYWRWIHSPYFMSDIYNLKNYPSAEVVTYFALLLAVCSILLALPFLTKLKKGVIFALFACCLLIDKTFFYHSRNMSSLDAINIYTQTPELARQFQGANLDNPLYRVFVDGTLTNVGLNVANSRKPEDYLYLRSLLPAIVGMDYGLYINGNLNGFREGSYQYVLDPWMHSLQGTLKQRMLELWNVKYAVGYSINEQRQMRITLQEYPNPAPRAWLSYSQYPMSSLRECLLLTQNISFNPRDTVLTVVPGAKIGVSKMTGTPGAKDVDSIHYTNNTVTIKATAERDAWLYISDTYEKGWRAYIDGKKTPVFRANMNGRAVAFPAGTHTVLFRYSPPSIWIGLWIGVIAWLAVAVFGIRKFWLSRFNATA